MPHLSEPLTFLFTDVEGSVRLWATDTSGTARSFERHDKLIRSTITLHNGRVFGTAGDSFRGAFLNPEDAVAAAIACQEGLAAMDWGEGPALRVRMGLHRGSATERDGDYLGPVPNTASRVEALGHGGQILMTSEVERAIDASFLWLGEYRLRDVPEPVSIYQIGDGHFSSLRQVNPALSSLPNLSNELFGRQQEVAQIRERLASSSVVTLTGYGGCGKTRLALEVAHQELPSRPDGCYFVDLSAVVEQSEFPVAVASAIRLTLTGSDPVRQILEFLTNRDALIVLDNCEHLVDMCAEFVLEFMQRCKATFLITSRQRLDIDGEQIVLVTPLRHDAPDSPAVALFSDRATTANPDIDASDLDPELVQEICSRIDGIPLAIELAAARVAVLSPAAILERMEDRFRLLSGGRQRRKRRTLEDTLDWSYGLLDPDEQQLFRRCGVFSGSFGLNAASSVSGFEEYQVIDLLQSLVVKSLVSSTRSEGITRFHLLETVRAYAIDRLDENDELHEARQLHLSFFGKMARSHSWAEACDISRSRELRIDWSNLSAALEWAATTARWRLAADMAFGCQGLWEHQVSATEGRRWITQILEELDSDSEANAEADSDSEGEFAIDLPRRIDQLRLNVALLAMQLDDFKTMHHYLLPLDESASPVPAAQALGFRAFTRIRHSRTEALDLLERADALVRRHNLGPEAATPSLWSRGTLALYDARFHDAMPHLEHAYRLARTEQATTTHGVIAGLACASNLVLLGRPNNALVVLDSGSWESVWDSSGVVRALALLDLGKASEAATLIVDFAHQALLGRLSRMSNDALVGFAALALSRGEHDRAWELLIDAVTPRTPASIGLAEGLADRVGRGNELRQLHRKRSVPLSSLDASAALRRELSRLSGE